MSKYLALKADLVLLENDLLAKAAANGTLPEAEAAYRDAAQKVRVLVDKDYTA